MKRFALLFLLACTPAETAPAPPAETAAPLPSALPAASTASTPMPPPMTMLDNGLQIEELRAGHGARATRGRTLSVHYVGTLESGKPFDSSRTRNQPFEFVLGGGSVIKGWEQGVEGMRVGETRRLTIPPDLGYGVRGHPPTIPPGAVLIFEIELLEIK